MRAVALLLLLGVARAEVPPAFLEQSAGVSAGPVVDRWWTTLDDPELNSLEERALAANLDLQLAAQRLLEARAARRVSRADLLPQVQSSDSLQRVRGGLTSGVFHPGSSANVIAPFETNIFQFGFDASWEIDLFGGKRHALKAATADVRAMEEARRDTLVSVAAEVARNYAELRGFQRRIAITRANIELQADSLHLTKVRAEAGLGNEFDVERQAAQLATTQAAEPSLRAAEAQAIHRISVLLALEPEKLAAELTEVKPVPTAPPAVPVGLPSDLLKRRPDVRQVDAEIAAATERVGVAHADLFPKISLTGNMGRQGTDFPGLTLGAGNFFAIGPAITLPIFTGGNIRANIAVQKERLEETVTQYRSVVLRSLEETEDALAAYGRERERHERLTAAVEASRQATGLASELYVRGLADFLSVLDAQRQQLAAEDDLAQSDAAVITDLVAVYKALGGGWNL